MFRLAAALPLIVALAAAFIDEGGAAAPEEPAEPAGEKLEKLRGAFGNPAVWKPALFIFLWQATPSSGDSFL